jgi:hypothetical protein
VRADQVMLAVADHQRLRRVERFTLHQMRDQLDLVGARAIQLAAVDHLEVPGEIEMPGDLDGEHRRLAGGDIQRAPCPPSRSSNSPTPSNSRFSYNPVSLKRTR